MKRIIFCSKFLITCFTLLSVGIFSANAQNPQSQSPIDFAEFTLLRQNSAAMGEFLRENDPAIFAQFDRGVTFRQRGRAFLIAGGATTAAGVGLMVAGASTECLYSGIWLVAAGYVGVLTGSGLMISSIPLYIVGNNFKSRAMNNFERQHFRNTSHTPTLDLYFTGNGVGLALRF